MGELFDEVLDGRDTRVDTKLLLDPGLEPGESIVWTGRPDPAALARKSVPTFFQGLFLIAFALFWMHMVVQGGNNNWDRGRVVVPYAMHNVVIAVCAGLWFLPFGVLMLTSPLRARWRAGRTSYILTDRRAVIIEPRVRRNHSVRNFSRESLALTRCEARPNGSGDLVFTNEKTGAGIFQPVGFLALENVREVEALVRKVQSLESTCPRTSLPGLHARSSC
jgi:hypothetical protein